MSELSGEMIFLLQKPNLSVYFSKGNHLSVANVLNTNHAASNQRAFC